MVALQIFFFLKSNMEMGIKESDITRRNVSLIGFSKDSKNIVGEVILPMYAKGVHLYTNILG